MTGHQRDPIEAWLSADVELLPPRPGAFERVHRRARHRRAMKAMTAAAGAAVIIAAGVTVPQLALTGTHGSGPARISAGSAVPSSSAAAGHGPSLSTAGRGPRPAAGFRPSSVTFVNGGALGAALGTASSCGGRCTVMAGTADYGRHWTRVGAPPAGPAHGSSGVSQVRFLDASSGWAYGPELFATHDGGHTWTRERLPVPGRVIDLSAIAGQAFVLIGIGCTGAGQDFGAGCASFSMFSLSATSSNWRLISGAGGGGGRQVPGDLQLTRNYGYLMSDGLLSAGQVVAGNWHAVSNAHPSTASCLTSPAGAGPRLIAPAADALYLVCPSVASSGSGPLSLFESGDRGLTWRQRGAVRVGGQATSLAVSPAGQLVLATTAGIYLTSDARTWHAAALRSSAPAGGFSFIGMTTASLGVAVPADPGLHELFVTRDGGRTWIPSAIQ